MQSSVARPRSASAGMQGSGQRRRSTLGVSFSLPEVAKASRAPAVHTSDPAYGTPPRSSSGGGGGWRSPDISRINELRRDWKLVEPGQKPGGLFVDVDDTGSNYSCSPSKLRNQSKDSCHVAGSPGNLPPSWISKLQEEIVSGVSTALATKLSGVRDGLRDLHTDFLRYQLRIAEDRGGERVEQRAPVQEGSMGHPPAAAMQDAIEKLTAMADSSFSSKQGEAKQEVMIELQTVKSMIATVKADEATLAQELQRMASLQKHMAEAQQASSCNVEEIRREVVKARETELGKGELLDFERKLTESQSTLADHITTVDQIITAARTNMDVILRRIEDGVAEHKAVVAGLRREHAQTKDEVLREVGSLSATLAEWKEQGQDQGTSVPESIVSALTRLQSSVEGATSQFHEVTSLRTALLEWKEQAQARDARIPASMEAALRSLQDSVEGVKKQHTDMGMEFKKLQTDTKDVLLSRIASLTTAVVEWKEQKGAVDESALERLLKEYVGESSSLVKDFKSKQAEVLVMVATMYGSLRETTQSPANGVKVAEELRDLTEERDILVFDSRARAEKGDGITSKFRAHGADAGQGDDDVTAKDAAHGAGVAALQAVQPEASRASNGDDGIFAKEVAHGADVAQGEAGMAIKDEAHGAGKREGDDSIAVKDEVREDAGQGVAAVAARAVMPSSSSGFEKDGVDQSTPVDAGRVHAEPGDDVAVVKDEAHGADAAQEASGVRFAAQGEAHAAAAGQGGTRDGTAAQNEAETGQAAFGDSIVAQGALGDSVAGQGELHRADAGERGWWDSIAAKDEALDARQGDAGVAVKDETPQVDVVQGLWRGRQTTINLQLPSIPAKGDDLAAAKDETHGAAWEDAGADGILVKDEAHEADALRGDLGGGIATKDATKGGWWDSIAAEDEAHGADALHGALGDVLASDCKARGADAGQRSWWDSIAAEDEAQNPSSHGADAAQGIGHDSMAAKPGAYGANDGQGYAGIVAKDESDEADGALAVGFAAQGEAADAGESGWWDSITAEDEAHAADALRVSLGGNVAKANEADGEQKSMWDSIAAANETHGAGALQGALGVALASEDKARGAGAGKGSWWDSVAAADETHAASALQGAFGVALASEDKTRGADAENGSMWDSIAAADETYRAGALQGALGDALASEDKARGADAGKGSWWDSNVSKDEAAEGADARQGGLVDSIPAQGETHLAVTGPGQVWDRDSVVAEEAHGATTGEGHVGIAAQDEEHDADAENDQGPTAMVAMRISSRCSSSSSSRSTEAGGATVSESKSAGLLHVYAKQGDDEIAPEDAARIADADSDQGDDGIVANDAAHGAPQGFLSFSSPWTAREDAGMVGAVAGYGDDAIAAKDRAQVAVEAEAWDEAGDVDIAVKEGDDRLAVEDEANGADDGQGEDVIAVKDEAHKVDASDDQGTAPIVAMRISSRCSSSSSSSSISRIEELDAVGAELK